MVSKLREDNVSHEQLLLDPNNYRFQDDPDFVWADEKRFHEPGVQERAFRKLRGNGLLQLKNSIITNGFLPVERLVVRPYLSSNDLFVVIEGNRRLAALRWIAEDEKAGVSIPGPIIASLKNVPVIVVEDADADPIFQTALMGVRHVSGIKDWGGYQRAKVIVQLRDEHGLESSEIADRLGISTHEVNRRYRALKALQQMQDDENFGEHSRPDMYPLFHEALSQPAVREWLSWDDTNALFTEEQELEHFYELITPTELEDTGYRRDPKIPTRSEVRELRDILTNLEAKRILLDPSHSFIEAVSIAKREELSRAWAPQVSATIGALQSIGFLELENLSDEDKIELIRLKDLIEKLLETREKLRS